jgi:hypothetical protein
MCCFLVDSNIKTLFLPFSDQIKDFSFFESLIFKPNFLCNLNWITKKGSFNPNLAINQSFFPPIAYKMIQKGQKSLRERLSILSMVSHII